MALLDRLNYKHIQKQLSLSPGIEAFPVRNLVSERFGFIDFVRFVSTIGIVWAHIQVFPGNATNYPVVLQNSEYYLGFKQITKFSVINFYLIAGFLLPTVIPSDNRFGYLKRRCRKTIKAYIAALSIFIAGIFISEKGFDLSSFNVTWAVKTVAYLIKYTSFWYLGSYLICLGILLAFSRWIGSGKFGLGLLAITVIQTFFTCYTQKFNVDHTLSVFPFIFYLWLGAFIRRMNYHEHFIKIPFRYLGFFIVVTGILATVESVYLLEHGYRNYFNVLRYSNQAYSIVFFVALVKIGTKVRIPRFLNPRKESFGIYLYHVFIIIFLYPHLSKAIEGVTGISLTSVSLLAIIPLEIFKFVVCYLISTILVKVLVKFKLLFLDLDNKREALKA